MALLVDVARIRYADFTWWCVSAGSDGASFVFPTAGDSLASGLVINGPDGSYLVKAKFVGFLADLKEHKTITEWKGTAGNVCCLQCTNVSRTAVGAHADGTVGLDCSDPGLFRRRSEDHLRDIVSSLVVEKARMSKTAFQKYQTTVGVNYCPDGILFDNSLRGLYDPVEHIIVDWMHTMCSDGVGNTCIWTALHFLRTTGYSTVDVREFMGLCTLPSKYGKVDPSWLHDNRIAGTSLTAFSNVVLNVVPLLYLFVEKFCSKDRRLTDVVRYVRLLYMIMGVLASGPDEAPQHCAIIRRNLSALHALHVKLSDDCKPKLHHMHHIVDGMQWLGKLLSCFVCERKHQQVKHSAVHVFRHLEHTVLHDVVNKQCQQLQEGVELFKSQFLENPQEVVGVSNLHRSARAVLPCGSLYAGDIVWLRSARCGRVVLFYEFGSDMVVHVSLYGAVDGMPDLCSEESPVDEFVDTAEVVDACTWFYESPSVLRVAVPPLALM